MLENVSLQSIFTLYYYWQQSACLEFLTNPYFNFDSDLNGCYLNDLENSFQARDLCIKNRTNVLLHRISNTYDFAFIYLYTQSTHIDNSKMVKWVHKAQKLTKIQGII